MSFRHAAAALRPRLRVLLAARREAYSSLEKKLRGGGCTQKLHAQAARTGGGTGSALATTAAARSRWASMSFAITTVTVTGLRRALAARRALATLHLAAAISTSCGGRRRTSHSTATELRL